MATETITYIAELQRNFSKYRDSRFRGLDNLFEAHKSGAVVFKPDQVEHNLLIPPCTEEERGQIVRKIQPAKRHKHFGSMQSSQALAQSVFGTIEVLNRLPLLSSVKSEDGLPAFGPTLNQTKLYFEKEVQTLGELAQHETQVDVCFEGSYCVALECKLARSAKANLARWAYHGCPSLLVGASPQRRRPDLDPGSGGGGPHSKEMPL